MVFLMILPIALAQVEVQLGEPYINIEDVSEIRFGAHSDYYEICSVDETVIPVLIKNKNKFSDIFRFEVDKDYALVPVKSAVIRSGKSAILPLMVSPPVGVEENTTLMLDIITKTEGLKRRVIIKTNIEKCYLFEMEIERDRGEICGCDKETYTVILTNEGTYTDTFTLSLNMPEWINSTLENETIKLAGGQKREIILEASPGCEEKGVFIVNVGVISEKSEAVLEGSLELTVLPQKECYDTVITADDVSIDYFGRNIPVIIKNKGAKDATYSLSVEGVDWYSLSQTDFSLKQNEEKTINLALYPDEGVVEGNYNIDIMAKIGDQEFTKSITVKLKSKGVIFEKIRFYLNYFRYYIGAGVVLLIIILLLVVFVKKRVKRKVKEKLLSPMVRAKLKPEEKVEVKEVVVKKAKKLSPWVKWLLFFILYLIFLGLLVLLTYSTFKYRSYYEKVLNFVSGLFANYVVPYLSYLRYVVLGVGAVGIILLIIDFIRKKPKKIKEKKEKKEKIKKEKPKEEKKEVRKVIEKKVEKRKLRLFEYIYLILVILLFLAIIVYAVYRFFGKPISLDRFRFITDFIKGYYLYFVIGIVVLLVLIAIIHLVNKVKKKPKKIKEKKVLYPIVRAKPELIKKIKITKKTKRLIKNIIITIIGLVVLSGIVYSFVYYDLISYIKDFFVVYYPYILMGMGILIILVLILHFQSKKIS